MGYFQDIAIDDKGNVLASASIEVRVVGTSTKVNIFTDSALTSAASNPLTTDTVGAFNFYVAARQVDLFGSKAGHSNATKTVEVQGTPIREAPSGALNGSNKVYTLTQTPLSGTLQFTINGVVQKVTADVGDPLPGAFTLSGTTITLTTAMFAPDTGDWIEATYEY